MLLILIRASLGIIMKIESQLSSISSNLNSSRSKTGLDALSSLFTMAMEELPVLTFSEINFTS
jgi:hypothetical protein